MQPAGGVDEHEVGAAARGRAHRVEDHRARVGAFLAPHEVGADALGPVASCSAAAARKVSPAASTTLWPLSASRWRDLADVVVFPTPLTPTNIHTLARRL